MNRAIIQAGGKGTRLHPYTTVLPKPLMPIGDYPILEIVIRQLVHHGFKDITITVGHLGHLIMAVLGDGSRLGARVRYHWEDQPRGTIGAISEVSDLKEPFLVMNGDLLTDFNFRDFMNQHLAGKATLSVGIYSKEIPVSLGVLDFQEDHQVIGFREKPVLSFPCSMGIYAFDPEVLCLIPRSGIFGFDDLMALCLRQKVNIRAHPFEGLWLDIGRPEDYASATDLFIQHQARLYPRDPRSKTAFRLALAGN